LRSWATNLVPELWSFAAGTRLRGLESWDIETLCHCQWTDEYGERPETLMRQCPVGSARSAHACLDPPLISGYW